MDTYFPLSGDIYVASWNVEGLTDIRIFEICTYMRANRIDVVCMQETRKSDSDSYKTELGFQVILSGGPVGEKEWAGVGFIEAAAFIESYDCDDYSRSR